MTYRKDIDGLRALAVLPVVLFHAGFGFFSGGFVGVDVFFVISGYLITGIIFGEIAQEKFSILRFYERRIRRIFPALFAVLAFTLIAGLMIFLPEDLKALSGSIVAATLFVSNILFWRESGYFATAAELKPLLHTWSLAVEEQFYIFFPLFLMLAWRWGLFRRSAQIVKWLTWAALLLSLAASIYGIRYHDEATFYMLPTRAWELLLGSVIALGAVPRVTRQWLREVLGALGIGLILYAVFVFDMTTPFPGEAALLPCLGAALIILTGETDAIRIGAGHATWAARLLGMRPFVFIGLISYSLYLWHWPLIVFTKYYMIFPLNQMQEAMVVLVSLIVATLSWRYIETPFRKGNDHYLTRNRARIFAVSGTAMSAAILIGLVNMAMQGWPQRMMDSQALRIVEDAGIGMELVKPCMHSYRDTSFKKPEDSCTFGQGKASSDIVLWGDSHADAILPALLKASQGTSHSIRTLLMGRCPPLMGVDLGNSPLESCRKFNDAAMAYLISGPERMIIIAGRWAAVIHGGNTGSDERSSPPGIARKPGQKLTREAALQLANESLTKTISKLKATGKTIVLVYPWPESSYDVPEVLARMLVKHSDEATMSEIQIPLRAYLARIREITALFDALPDAANFHRIKPADMLCNETRCLVFKDGKSLYFDDDHLSQAGAEYLSPLFAPVFNPSAN